MTKDEALKSSRDKWDRLLVLAQQGFETVIEEATKKCGLCDLYWSVVDKCHGCPLSLPTVCYERYPQKVFHDLWGYDEANLPYYWKQQVMEATEAMHKIVHDIKIEDMGWNNDIS